MGKKNGAGKSSFRTLSLVTSGIDSELKLKCMSDEIYENYVCVAVKDHFSLRLLTPSPPPC